MSNEAQAVRAQIDAPPDLPAPLEIDWPELHPSALGCGVEDRDIRDRYEAANYGFQDCLDQAASRIPEDIYTSDQMREFAVQHATAVMADHDDQLRAANERIAALREALRGMVEIAELTIGWFPTPPGADGPLIVARAALATNQDTPA